MGQNSGAGLKTGLLFPSAFLVYSSIKVSNALLIYYIYCSPPCRQFTPKLAEFYKSHAQAKNFEIVFLSSDRDEAAFKEYYGEMPWLALPFEKADLKAALSKKYKVQGIPTLVIVDKVLLTLLSLSLFGTNY